MTSVLKNVTVNWVYANRPDNFGKYSIQAVLNDEHVDQLKKEGVAVKDRDGKKIYNFTKPVQNRNGEDTKPIGIYQAGSEFDGLVPNGAKANIKYNPKSWSVAGRTGTKAYIISVELDPNVEPYVSEGNNDSTDDNPFE